MPYLPISVIICAKNAESTIKDCLQSVRESNPVEIVMIDGLSTDRTVEIARGYTNLIYSDEGRGFTYSQQMGADKATQEYIVYVDADVIVPPGTLVTMLTEFKDGEYVSICAQVKPVALSNYWEWAVQQHIEIVLLRQGGGSLMCGLLRRDTLMKNRFDSFITPGPDFDFYLKMRSQGYKFGLSSAFIYHQHRANLKSFIKQRLWYGGGKARFVWKGKGGDTRVWPPLVTVYMTGYCLVKGRPKLIPYFLLGGIIETWGMMKCFLKLAIGALKRNVK